MPILTRSYNSANVFYLDITELKNEHEEGGAHEVLLLKREEVERLKTILEAF